MRSLRTNERGCVFIYKMEWNYRPDLARYVACAKLK